MLIAFLNLEFKPLHNIAIYCHKYSLNFTILRTGDRLGIGLTLFCQGWQIFSYSLVGYYYKIWRISPLGAWYAFAMHQTTPQKVWDIVDKLMDTLKIVNQRTYDGVMRKIEQI